MFYYFTCCDKKFFREFTLLTFDLICLKDVVSFVDEVFYRFPEVFFPFLSRFHETFSLGKFNVVAFYFEEPSAKLT